VLADYPVYRWLIHGDGTNSSSGQPDVDGYWANIVDSLAAVTRLTPDPDRRARIAMRWLAGTIAPNLGPRLLGRPRDYQDEWLRRAAVVVAEHFPPEADGGLSGTIRLRVAALRRGDHDLVRAVAAEDVGITTRPSLLSCAWNAGALEVSAEAVLVRNGAPVPFSRRDGRVHRRLTGDLGGLAPGGLLDVTDDLAAAAAEMKVVDRATSVDWYLPAESTIELAGDERDGRLVARSTSRLDPSIAALGEPLERGVWDYVSRVKVLGVDSRRRLSRAPGVSLPALVDGRPCVAYSTENGALSLDVGHRSRTIVGSARPGIGDATATTTADGSRVAIRLDRVHIRGTASVPAELLLEGAIHEGSLSLPARISADGAVARVEGYLSALPGDYPLRVRSLDRRSGPLMRLVVASDGAIAFRSLPAKAPRADRGGLRRVPGLRLAARAVRGGRRRIVGAARRVPGVRRLAKLAGKRRP
jgi:hypothetical protein